MRISRVKNLAKHNIYETLVLFLPPLPVVRVTHFETAGSNGSTDLLVLHLFVLAIPSKHGAKMSGDVSKCSGVIVM
jgi:hypothetical protein